MSLNKQKRPFDMNRLVKNFRTWINVCLCVAALMGAAGCGTPGGSPSSKAGAAVGHAPGTSAAHQSVQGDVIRVGDPIAIAFSGVVDPPATFNERLKADGMIQLPLIKEPITAVGKTRAALEDEIHKLYVPNIYKRLTVKVGAEGRFLTVDGEIRVPGRVQYLGEMTVLKAISAAGGFNDFANRKKVLLRRADGTEIRVNCTRALEDPKSDLAVFPDDYISVPRRYF